VTASRSGVSGSAKQARKSGGTPGALDAARL
jgi:hypothetical protein